MGASLKYRLFPKNHSVPKAKEGSKTPCPDDTGLPNR